MTPHFFQPHNDHDHDPVSWFCQFWLSFPTAALIKTTYHHTIVILPSLIPMAPLMMIDIQDHAFCNERFSYPLKRELESVQIEKPRRRVRFNRERKVINPETEFYTDEDIRIKWFGMDDLGNIKQAAKEMSITIRKRSKASDCFLTMAHRKTSLILAANFKSLMRLTPSTPDKDLQGWCACEDGRRGLERFASKDYSILRRQDIIKTRETVLTEQQRQRESGMHDPEAIAKLSREASRRARTFSLFFGEADAPDLGAKTAPPTSMRMKAANFERRAPPRKRSKMVHASCSFHV